MLLGKLFRADPFAVRALAHLDIAEALHDLLASILVNDMKGGIIPEPPRAQVCPDALIEPALISDFLHEGMVLDRLDRSLDRAALVLTLQDAMAVQARCWAIRSVIDPSG